VTVRTDQRPFTLQATSVQEGADALIHSIRRLVELPSQPPAILGGSRFPDRHPQDVADYLHPRSMFEV
jgi:hypothetical protein